MVPLGEMRRPHVERPLQGKEAYFTDDGFAIGIAYILAILNQTKVIEGVTLPGVPLRLL